MGRGDLLTHQKKSCSLVVHSSRKTPLINFGFKKSPRSSHVDSNYLMMRRYARSTQLSRDSVYIPAGRTGSIQLFTSITQVRNRFLRDLLGSFRSKDSFNVKKHLQKKSRVLHVH